MTVGLAQFVLYKSLHLQSMISSAPISSLRHDLDIRGNAEKVDKDKKKPRQNV